MRQMELCRRLLEESPAEAFRVGPCGICLAIHPIEHRYGLPRGAGDAV